MTEPADVEGGGEPHQPMWRKVLLLAVPALILSAFLAAQVWYVVSDHFGEREARLLANEVESVARDRELTAMDLRVETASGGPVELMDELEVPGTYLETVEPGDGAGDAHVVLRATAWGGSRCIRLNVGVDGDISSDQRRC